MSEHKTEPVAWMWQHDETGMTGFVQHAPEEELRQWERMNKPRKIVSPLYAAIPQAVSAEPQWIPAYELMPQKDVEVLVYDSSADHVYVTQWCDWWEAPVSFSGQTICVGEGWETGELEHITHWMPLPPAPKEPQ